MDYDLTVIGAGIQGVGVAQAAAADGYRVLVIERAAPAAATSSRSSKLIHGGLRYLETGQFALVRESLGERERLLRLAPELVRLIPMHIPVYRGDRRHPLTIGLGLALYWLLAGGSPRARFSRLPRADWPGVDGLRTEGLRCVYRYHEAQTDDRALTEAVLRSARSLGAELAMPAQCVGIERSVDHCRVVYRQEGAEHAVTSRAVVNCAGPWAARLLETVRPPVTVPSVELVQGAHLLLPPLLERHYYLLSPVDGRAVFALPWQGRLLVGTTETPFSGDPDSSHCLDSERDYLLTTLAHAFPAVNWRAQPVESFAGLRVLPASDRQASRRSREVLLSADDERCPRLLSVMGGKLTTYRATARQVMDRLAPSLPPARPVADTAQLLLTRTE